MRPFAAVLLPLAALALTAPAPAQTPAAAPAAPPPGTVPDLAGRTARVSVATLAGLDLRPVLSGHGVVVRQRPEPGAPMPPPGTPVLLELDTGAGG